MTALAKAGVEVIGGVSGDAKAAVEEIKRIDLLLE